MTQLLKLVSYTNDLLQIDRFQDYCPNGLQVQGRCKIKKLISGVTASLALIDAAISADADAILVHHGYFWRGEDMRIVGMKQQRLKRLLHADISLLAYHLPLDAHSLYGNNVQLAKRLGLSVEGQFGNGSGPAIGRYGRLHTPMQCDEFAKHITQVLHRQPLHLPGVAKRIQTIAWCTGAAQEYIHQAIELDVDAYLTGEVSEQTVHIARECGIHFYAAGHHATERYGSMSLAKHLAEHFDLEEQFIDIENPV